MKKEEFKNKAQSVLDELSSRIDEMETRANEIADDAKEEYYKQLDNLKELKSQLSTKLDEFDKIADSKWDVVKESAGEFFNSVSSDWKESYAKIVDAFKKKEHD
jgi:F0F1-type ATP synthase membrane subunit b/b'